ncbi:hypothetical protein ABFS83_01G005900 [Erythranthe nasuta]
MAVSFLLSLSSRFLRRSIAAAGLTSQTVEIDDDGGTTIHLWGPPAPTSKPPVLLIHGLGPQSIWQWRNQISFFARDFDVYVPDLLFFGDSFTKSTDRTEIFQATCLAKLLQKLGIPRYSIVGTNYGGFVAYHMAAMWPERVEKVVFASCAVNMSQRDTNELMERAKVEKIEDLLMPVNATQLRKLLSFIAVRPPYLPDFLLKGFAEKLYSKSRKEKLELLKEVTIGKDDTVTISPLQQEILIVWGEHDQIFPLEKAVELEKLLGEKARLHVIKNASHANHLEQAAQFNNVVNNFLHGP